MPTSAEPRAGTPERAPVLVVGTGSIHVRRFVAGLCAAGQTVVALTDGAEPLPEHPLLLEQRRVDFAIRSAATPSAIGAAIARWRPRIVHAHQANSVSWHAARAVRGHAVPLLVTIWGSDVLVIPQQGVLKRLMVRSALRAADFWSADAADLIAAASRVAGTRKPSAVIPIGVDAVPDDLAPLWAGKQDRVLSCRLHKPLYRIDRIVEAFAAIAARAPSWRLEVAASGSESERLVAAARASVAAERIEFPGYLTSAQLQASYTRCSVYVSFPESDGTSVSLLEAMAHGCYPVVADLPANREWIVDRLNGRIVADPADLATALEDAMTTSRSTRWRETMAPANRRLIAERALFSANIDAFLRCYDALPS